MEVVKVVHMNGGDSSSSYAHNSLLQKKVLSMTKFIREEAIHKVDRLLEGARTLTIADLGCSSGPNTLSVIHEVITSIYKTRFESDDPFLPVDFQVFLNDLPGNDFNAIFKSLSSFHTKLKNDIGKENEVNCFVNGVPGSFYNRLFDAQSLHFVHSSYSLHFLSQVPKGMGRSNKNNVFLGIGSPASVIRAYYEQFKSDFAKFLKHRSKELVNGGIMVITFVARRSDDYTSKDSSAFVWQFLSLVLKQMVSEGKIEEEKLDLFNMPKYMPSPTEIEIEVKKEGSFVINCLHVSEVDWDTATYTVNHDVVSDVAYTQEAPYLGFLNCMRAVSEPMLVDHFGEGLMDEVFRRFGEALRVYMAKERGFFTNITVSLTKNI